MSPQLPELPPPPEDGGDELAQKEASAIANDELEKRAAVAEHGRSETIKNHLLLAAVAVFWLGVLLVVIGMLTLGWHMLAPAPYCWLADGSVSQLKALLSGMVLSGGAQSYAKRYLK